jgi:hypothetical protein
MHIHDLTLLYIRSSRQFNDPVRQATTQFGLSILRFSGSDVTPLFEAGPDDPPPVVPEYVAEMDVRLIRNEFVDNIYFLSGDRAVSDSMRIISENHCCQPVRSRIAHSVVLLLFLLDLPFHHRFPLARSTDAETKLLQE